MTDIQVTGIDAIFQIPSCYDEFVPSYFLTFSNLYIQLIEKIITIDELKSKMAMEALGITQSWRINYLDEIAKDQVLENIAIVSETFDFLFSENEIEGVNHLSCDFGWSKCHLPTYKNFTGPGDLLSNLTFLAYKNAHVSSIQFLNSANTDDLNNLCSHLYLPPAKILRFPERIIPKDYSEKAAESYLHVIAKWPYHVKYAIFLDFMSFERYIKSGTFNIDGSEVCFAPLFTGGEDDPNNTGLTGVMFTLAESGVFGTADQTSKQNLFDVFFRLYQLHHQFTQIDKL